MDISMENVSQIVQKVRQAHWRVQRQWIGLFLLGLVAVSMVAAIYLNVTVRATLAGREVHDPRPVGQHEETDLAAGQELLDHDPGTGRAERAA